MAAGREVTVSVSEADLLAAQKALLRASYRNPVNLAVMAAMWLAMTALLSLVLPVAALALFAMVAAVSIFAVPPLIVVLFGRRAARRNLKAVPAFQAPLHYSWSEEGISCETVSGRSFLRWPAFRRWLEDGELLMVWPHPLTYQLLPKRAFTPEQIDEIRAFLIAGRAGT